MAVMIPSHLTSLPTSPLLVVGLELLREAREGIMLSYLLPPHRGRELKGGGHNEHPISRLPTSPFPHNR